MTRKGRREARSQIVTTDRLSGVGGGFGGKSKGIKELFYGHLQSLVLTAEPDIKIVAKVNESGAEQPEFLVPVFGVFEFVDSFEGAVGAFARGASVV